MTREEHLKFCKTCVNRKADFKIGLICGLTDKIADFEEECQYYEKDMTPPPPKKNNLNFDLKEFTQKFTPENLKKLSLGGIVIIITLIIYYFFGVTRQTLGGIVSFIIIIAGWQFFYSIVKNIFFNKSSNIKILLLFSLVSTVLTVTVFDNIVYGDDINSILANLDDKSPKTKTVILEKEFRDTYRYKRKEIEAKWIYEYEINIGNEIIKCRFATQKDIYKIGDSILVAYDTKTPKISKILMKIN